MPHAVMRRRYEVGEMAEAHGTTLDQYVISTQFYTWIST
jgi:hypothetical protein